MVVGPSFDARLFVLFLRTFISEMKTGQHMSSSHRRKLVCQFKQNYGTVISFPKVPNFQQVLETFYHSRADVKRSRNDSQYPNQPYYQSWTSSPAHTLGRRHGCRPSAQIYAPRTSSPSQLPSRWRTPPLSSPAGSAPCLLCLNTVCGAELAGLSCKGANTIFDTS